MDANIRKRIVTVLEREFIASRGRTLSLPSRYPDLFGPRTDADFHYLSREEDPVSMLVARRCSFGSSVGAMVGFVHTIREEQGKGLAAGLLDALADAEAAAGSDFLVLWARQVEYYQMHDWKLGDAGLMGEAQVSALPPPAPANCFQPVHSLNPASLPQSLQKSLQSLRDASGMGGIPSSLRDWRRVPLPFDSVELLMAGPEKSAPAGYALIGCQADWLCVIECAGDDDAYATLWNALLSRRANIRINVARGSGWQRWLADNTRFTLKPHPLMLVLPLSSRFDAEAAASWWVPWFDRI